MFPEGTRSRGGDIGKVRSGAAVIAAQHGVDIVPIYVNGTHDAMPPGQNWPKRRPGRCFSRRHKVEVRFGDPIRPRDDSAAPRGDGRGAGVLGARGPAAEDAAPVGTTCCSCTRPCAPTRRVIARAAGTALRRRHAALGASSGPLHLRGLIDPRPSPAYTVHRPGEPVDRWRSA